MGTAIIVTLSQTGRVMRQAMIIKKT